MTAGKIKDGEVKAAEIATDAIGASEIAGVTKLLFADCTFTFNASIDAQVSHKETCLVTGVDSDDNVVGSAEGLDDCFAIRKFDSVPNAVDVHVINACSTSETPGTFPVSLIIYDN